MNAGSFVTAIRTLWHHILQWRWPFFGRKNYSTWVNSFGRMDKNQISSLLMYNLMIPYNLSHIIIVPKYCYVGASLHYCNNSIHQVDVKLFAYNLTVNKHKILIIIQIIILIWIKIYLHRKKLTNIHRLICVDNQENTWNILEYHKEEIHIYLKTKSILVQLSINVAIIALMEILHVFIYKFHLLNSST